MNRFTNITIISFIYIIIELILMTLIREAKTLKKKSRKRKKKNLLKKSIQLKLNFIWHSVHKIHMKNKILQIHLFIFTFKDKIKISPMKEINNNYCTILKLK